MVALTLSYWMWCFHCCYLYTMVFESSHSFFVWFAPVERMIMVLAAVWIAGSFVVSWLHGRYLVRLYHYWSFLLIICFYVGIILLWSWHGTNATLGHFQPYDCVHKMLWFESFQVIPVSFFLAVQIGGVVYGLIWYWSFGFVNPLLLSYGSNTDWSFSTCFVG